MDTNQTTEKQTPWAIIVVIIAAILALVIWQSLDEEPEVAATPEPVEVIEPEPVAEPEPIEIVKQEVIEPPAEPIQPEPVPIEEPEKVLPELDQSDLWVQEKLPSLTWRKELLKLVVNEDMIRRFVVFTDNFAQGQLAYEHSPFVKPATSFSAIENKGEGTQVQWQWDEGAARRFGLYVDLLRSVDTDTLITWYQESKPLLDEAYAELGYPDADFTDTLQDAIVRVLDMDIPKEPLELSRPSVMYKYADPSIEDKDNADKLLLRLGRENLLVVKSILLEINDKLSRADS